MKIAIATNGKKITDLRVIILYPNPTTDGHFSVAMQYPHKTDATISIYSPTGTLIKQKHLTQIEIYLYDDTINSSSGMYLFFVNSEFGTKNLKLL